MPRNLEEKLNPDLDCSCSRFNANFLIQLMHASIISQQTSKTNELFIYRDNVSRYRQGKTHDFRQRVELLT